MIATSLHRRDFVAASLGGAVAAATCLTFLALRGASAPDPAKTQSGTWQPPTWWDQDPEPVRKRYLDFDRWVFEEHRWQGAPSPSVVFLVDLVAGLAGGEDGKMFLSRYFRDTSSPHYLANLLAGLDPARTAPPVRRFILASADRIWRAAGTGAIAEPVLAPLEALAVNPLETDARVLAMLPGLIARIKGA